MCNNAKMHFYAMQMLKHLSKSNASILVKRFCIDDQDCENTLAMHLSLMHFLDELIQTHTHTPMHLALSCVGVRLQSTGKFDLTFHSK